MNRLYLLLTLIIFLILTGCNSKDKYQFNNVDWTRFRGSDGNSISIEKGWNPEAIAKNKKLKPLWMQETGMGYSSVSIKGDYVYTLGLDRKDFSENVICMNINDGKIKWQYNFPSRAYQYVGSRSTPFLEDNYIYVTGCNGQVLCLDALSGSLIWQRDLIKDFQARRPTWGFAGSPAIEGDLLIVNANTNGIALNKKTGDTVWASSSGICGYATPVAFTYNDVRYTAIFGMNKLYIVEVSNGKVLTDYDWVTSYDINAADPIISGNKIFISSDYGKGSECLELKDNKLTKLWSSDMGNHFTTSVLIGNYLYGVSGNIDGNTILKCIDFNTGEKKWEDGKELYSSFIIADENKMIGISTIGKLFIGKISESGFKKISENKLKNNIYWTTPVLCRGMIFIRNQSGNLYCIDVRK